MLLIESSNKVKNIIQHEEVILSLLHGGSGGITSLCCIISLTLLLDSIGSMVYNQISLYCVLIFICSAVVYSVRVCGDE